jgi:hypothetical protein
MRCCGTKACWVKPAHLGGCSRQHKLPTLNLWFACTGTG